MVFQFWVGTTFGVSTIDVLTEMMRIASPETGPHVFVRVVQVFPSLIYRYDAHSTHPMGIGTRFLRWCHGIQHDPDKDISTTSGYF